LLKWSDVDWDKQTFTVHAPKTERHDGHDKRTVPIFPELAKLLQEAWEHAEPGEAYVLPMMQGRADSWFRKPIIKAILSCGEQPWDKLFTSLRATRDTELREQLPSHVVDMWIGHNEAIAKRNYLQVTSEHYAKAVQNPVQHPAAQRRTEVQKKVATPAFPSGIAA
jgi:integrase